MVVVIVTLVVGVAVVGDEQNHAAQRLLFGAGLAGHREVVCKVDHTTAVVDDRIYITVDHRLVEVGDL